MADFNRVSAVSTGQVAAIQAGYIYGKNSTGHTIRTDDGINWSGSLGYVGTPLDLISYGGNLYSANSSGAIKRSTDNGSNWSAAMYGGLYSYTRFVVFDSYLYCSGRSSSTSGQRGSICRTNNGTSWSAVGGDNMTGTWLEGVSDMCVFDNQLYAVFGAYVTSGSYKVFRTANGTTWTKVLDVSDKLYTAGEIGSKLYIFPLSGAPGTFGTGKVSSSGDLSSWSNTGSEFTCRHLHHASTIDNRVWCVNTSGHTTMYTGNGTTMVNTTEDRGLADNGNYFVFDGFVYYMCGADGLFKGPAATGYRYTETFTHPTNQDFGWQAAVHGIQNDPPA